MKVGGGGVYLGRVAYEHTLNYTNLKLVFFATQRLNISLQKLGTTVPDRSKLFHFSNERICDGIILIDELW